MLTGALGVGVGFGLQNIVNNFVSGLILQFERPIHIGDVLDIDGTTGAVTHIGIRSSTVKTFQGAEVIIPNANFISGKVINWTLSSSLRRAELPMGVAYGSDPKLVSKLLDQAARLMRACSPRRRLPSISRNSATAPEFRTAVLGDAGKQRRQGEE